MAISIHLKKLSINDSQEVFIDKLEYNMNQLVELGLGQPGPPGKGDRGYPGNNGGIGLTGERGSIWSYGTNVNAVTDMLVGDSYIDTANSVIYNYTENSPDYWAQIIDIGALITAMYQQDASATFMRLNASSDAENTIISFQDAGESPQPSDSQRDALFLFDFSFDSLDTSDNVDIIRAGLLNIYTNSNSRYSTIIGDGDLLVGTAMPTLANSLKTRVYRDGSYNHAYFNFSYDVASSEIARYSGFKFHTSSIGTAGGIASKFDARYYFGPPTYVNRVYSSITTTGFAAFAMHETTGNKYLSINLETDGVGFHTSGTTPFLALKFKQDIKPYTTNTFDIGSSSAIFNEAWVNQLKDDIYVGSGMMGIGESYDGESAAYSLYLNAGVYMNGDVNKTIIIGANSSSGQVGKNLTIQAGSGYNSSKVGGALYLYAGALGSGGGAGATANGPSVYIRGGAKYGGTYNGLVVLAESSDALFGGVTIGTVTPISTSHALTIKGDLGFTTRANINMKSSAGAGLDLSIAAGAGSAAGDLYLDAGAAIASIGTVYVNTSGNEGTIELNKPQTAGNDSDQFVGVNIAPAQHLHVNCILRLEPYVGTLVQFTTAFTGKLDDGDMFVVYDAAAGTYGRKTLYIHFSGNGQEVNEEVHVWNLPSNVE